MRRRVAKGGERCPSGKRRFRDRQSAAAAITYTKQRSTREVVPVRCYECPQCHGWHLTSKR